MKRTRLVFLIVWYLWLGVFASLAHTWVVANDVNRYGPGWLPYFSSGYWIGKPRTTTGWMIVESSPDGRKWSVLGVRNGNHRIYQVRHEVNYRGYTGVERDYKPEFVPSWTRVAPFPSIEEMKSYTSIIEQMNGWPFLAWRGEAKFDRRGLGAKYTWCFPSNPKAGSTAWEFLELLPYEPVFPGVLYNSIFFGGVLFVFVRILKHTRRRIVLFVRSRRHQCTNCKYNITGLSTCPECGQSVVNRATVKL